ncbi:hypothetical protein D5W64_12085 [Salmonella enterica subsp. enterica serovar Saintpaul]|nr:hypothetical protein [Salmonella enterica subsp. enterica serovar Saintpaul]
MPDVKVVSLTILLMCFALLIVAVWVGGLLLREAEGIKDAVNKVGGAFDTVTLEIESKLKANNVIAYADLLMIVAKVGKMIPGVDIKLDTDFKLKRVTIRIQKDNVKMSYTILATLVEYTYKTPVAVQE